MNPALFIYLANICDTFKYITIFALVALIFFYIITFFCYNDKDICADVTDEDRIWIIKKFKFSLYFFFSLLLLEIALPTEKTMYLMAGASYLNRSDIPPKIEKIIEKKLNEYLLDSDKDKK